MKSNKFSDEQILINIKIQRGIINARWFLIIGLSLLGIFLRAVSQKEFLLGLPPSRIGLLMAIAISFNLSYYFYLKNETKVTQRGINVVSFLQVTIDIILYSVIIFLSGGITATAFMFYLYAFINAAALYHVKGVLYAVFLSIFFYTAIIGLEYYEYIDHIYGYASQFEPNHFQNYAYTFVNYITVIFSLAIGGGFSSVISELLEIREKQIKTERDRVSSVIEHLPNGILLINNAHQITFANKQAAQLLKTSQTSLINLIVTKQRLQKTKSLKHLDKLFFPSDKYRSPTLKKEYEIILDDTQQTILKIETILVSNLDNQMLGFMKVIQDVTREKSIDRMKSEFISIAAHQLRTPLSAIKWSLKMILDGDLGKPPAEMEDFISKSYKTNERMIRLVNDLLNVSRIEEGRFFYKLTPLNIEDLINGMILDFIPLCNDKKITINWKHSETSLPMIRADSDHLRLAIQNILDNALKYTPINGIITVALNKSKTNNDIIISIKDSGVGIPADEQKRIFSKFYRGTNVLKMQTDGSGLGLFIVKNIIDRHEGTVSFESSEKGTRFIITLPPSHDKNSDPKEPSIFQRFITQF